MSDMNETLDAVREVNLSYLLLAQRLLRDDPQMGQFRLGLSAESAGVVAGLTLAQTVKLAASSQLLCSFRLTDHNLLAALADKARSPAMGATHAAILMAGAPAHSLI